MKKIALHNLIITYADLEKAKACSSQLNLFQETFGDRVRFTKTNIEKAILMGLDIKWAIGVLPVFNNDRREMDERHNPNWFHNTPKKFRVKSIQECLLLADNRPSFLYEMRKFCGKIITLTAPASEQQKFPIGPEGYTWRSCWLTPIDNTTKEEDSTNE